MEYVQIGKISIIQSLPAEELNSAVKIEEDIRSSNAFFDRNFVIERVCVSGKHDFFMHLNVLTEEAKSGLFPIVHIECHGSDKKDGIVLEDGTFISWFELKPALIKLNVASRLNLIVVLSACYGAYMGTVIDPGDRAPCWAFAGPTNVTKPIELINGFSAFYQALLKELDCDSASKVLMEKELENGVYYFIPADFFFKKSYQQYLKNMKTPGYTKSIAKRIRKRLIKKGVVSVSSIKDINRQVFDSKMMNFDKHLESYFMFDLYPENRGRFKVAIEDVRD